jgi:hypothetical protein
MGFEVLTAVDKKKESCLLGYNAVSSGEGQLILRRKISHSFSGLKNKEARNQHEADSKYSSAVPLCKPNSCMFGSFYLFIKDGDGFIIILKYDGTTAAHITKTLLWCNIKLWYRIHLIVYHLMQVDSPSLAQLLIRFVFHVTIHYMFQPHTAILRCKISC